MPRKMTIVLPDNVANHLEEIKNKLQLSTFSGTASLGIEILNWTVEKYLEGYEVKAEKLNGSQLTIEKCPLLMPKK
jgi:hypothetical protein